MSHLRRGLAFLMLLTGGLSTVACQSKEKVDPWLTVQLVDNRMVLSIGGQCGAQSFLRRLEVADTVVPNPSGSGSGRHILWSVRQLEPTTATPTVTVGQVPTGFEEITPMGSLTWPISLDVWTNFRYGVHIPQGDLAGGAPKKYAPQPIWNEKAEVHPPNC
ncbi:hypothetical protein GCM10010172_71250 [Paractinoplanes ferrugineus]|uniref:Lipoprotein n=1 Tax=Paractinoplanes ferrugineus TaxID=113564 RepID=A0A919J5S9_9ACTN|nr:hypothetical protein [Actinoplanes ferrugineus]GIE15010.1 hypothetical protein Afe05nite_68500 [Actinoplanes ferrugineus]